MLSEIELRLLNNAMRLTMNHRGDSSLVGPSDQYIINGLMNTLNNV